MHRRELKGERVDALARGPRRDGVGDVGVYVRPSLKIAARMAGADPRPPRRDGIQAPGVALDHLRPPAGREMPELVRMALTPLKTTAFAENPDSVAMSDPGRDAARPEGSPRSAVEPEHDVCVVVQGAPRRETVEIGGYLYDAPADNERGQRERMRSDVA